MRKPSPDHTPLPNLFDLIKLLNKLHHDLPCGLHAFLQLLNQYPSVKEPVYEKRAQNDDGDEESTNISPQPCIRP